MAVVRLAVVGSALLVAAVLTACSGSSSGSEVPHLGSGGAHPGSSTDRATALHAAAQCIREHGVPTYQDPVLGADGEVYTDTRSLINYAKNQQPSGGGGGGGSGKAKVKDTGGSGRDTSGSGRDTSGPDDALAAGLVGIRQACGRLMTLANLRPLDQPPAPAALVQAGVKAARCQRANGMPNVKDPTSDTDYTPGHGFEVSPSSMPVGGKRSPGFQQAYNACRKLIDDEVRLSTLGNLPQG